MASVRSTSSAAAGVRFSATFVANIPQYQRAIYRQPVMRWARERSLDDDLVQLALLDLARVEARFDPARATSPHHFLLAVLGSRVSDCADRLMRMHRDTVDNVADDYRDEECDDNVDGARAHSHAGHAEDDPVVERAVRAQFAAVAYAGIATLPARQREVIALALEDETDKEIAVRLGVSVQSVNKTRLAARVP